MNIGIISTIGNDYSWAGSEEMWRGMAVKAIESNHMITLSAAPKIAQSNKVKELKKEVVKVFSREDLNAITRRLVLKQLYSRFGAFFKNKPDVLCISMGGIADFYWLPDLVKDLSKYKVPYVVIVQANAEGIVSSQKVRDVLKKFYSQASKVVFVSKHNLKLARRQICYNFANSIVISNPLREEIENTIAWNSEEETLKMAEVARLDVTDKQQDHLLEALSDDQWKDRDWNLTFYGSGADESHIRDLIKFYGLEEKVTIGGFVEDFRDIWLKHHIHVLPSRREGMPLSIIESMACGRPAVVTHAGGGTELVDDGVNGFICPGMHPEVLRDTLERVWNNKKNLEEMGALAAEKINHVLFPNWAEKITTVLEEAIALK